MLPIMDQSLSRDGKIILLTFFVLFILSSCNRHQDGKLFILDSLQDSLETFIMKNKESIVNPYEAPTVGLVTIDTINKDTIITFMANINLIKFVKLNDTDRPLMELQGACMQDGMIIIIYGSKEYPDIVNYNLLNLDQKDYDYFYSYQGPNKGFELYPISYRRYHLVEGQKLDLQYYTKSRFEIE